MAKKMTKAERLAEGVKKAVGAGRPVAVETVDFSDPDRSPTCLEVDFPILPVNQVAAIEGNAGKPIYQVSKWWARRRSSVFRSILLAAAMKAPDDPLEAAKAVWDVYYANHQKKGALSQLKVLDPFMGGGTTIVEGSRLGMDMTGVDLNPVAWFVVKTELAQVDKREVEALLADVEAEVKPQIMPFYACDCPRGHKGKWTKASTGEVMGEDFDPLTLEPKDRRAFSYQGPEIIYVFWARHGPCQVTGCNHRTPIMSKPVVAIKTMTIQYWKRTCKNKGCTSNFHLEEQETRLAPGVALVNSESETPYTFIAHQHELAPPKSRRVDYTCPHCGHGHLEVDIPEKPTAKKKVDFTLLMHSDWLEGEKASNPDGKTYGGSVTDDAASTASWNDARASKLKLYEVRGPLPEKVLDPHSGKDLKTGSDGGTVPKRSHFACGACGTVQDLLTTVKATGKSGPMAAYVIQGYCPDCSDEKVPYGGRFFAPVSDTRAINAANFEWERRSVDDLEPYWPKSELPYGFMTHQNNGGIPNHGYSHWWMMFNSRQLLVHTQLLKEVATTGVYEWSVREAVLSAFQQYLRNQNMFSIWDISRDGLAPMLSNSNFHPKANCVENSVFSNLGRGNWTSCVEALMAGIEWTAEPWERVSRDRLATTHPEVAKMASGRSEVCFPRDPVQEAQLVSGSATEIPTGEEQFDLAITDPPFGGLLHYSELSDFFYVWLRLVLRQQYPEVFAGDYVPKVLEIVENRTRNPEDPGGMYQRLLTQAWADCHRVLKPGGILAFTFHHSEDEPWVQVLQSLFDAGFYLEATYPIRSDETKGQGAKPGTFGSQKVEYDIVHVCRKRREEPKPVSWAKMRRAILREVRHLQSLLEHHQEVGLPEADIQVIKRGKALEYYSRHYGKVYEAEGQLLSVRDAVLGVLQVLDEQANPATEPPPVTASPYTRQLLRVFGVATKQPRDQVQKFLRGTSISPDEFETKGWVFQDNKVYHLTPFFDLAKEWQGKHRANLVHDYDQAAVLVGACFDGSGIKAEDTLSNPNFKPHPGLGPLLQWFAGHSSDPNVRTAAGRADRLFRSWREKNREADEQLKLFGDDGVED